MIQVAICDDMEIFVKMVHEDLEKILMENKEEFAISDYTDGNKLLTEYEAKKFDLVILDIEMPEIGGFEVATALNKMEGRTKIIFLTGYTSLVYDSFQFHPFAFIPKDNLNQYFPRYIHLFLEALQKERQLFSYLDADGQESVIPLREIMLFSVVNHDIQFVTSQGDVQFIRSHQTTLMKLYTALEKYGFLLTSRSELVNYQYIDDVQENFITLKNGHKLKISKRKYQEIRRAFFRLLASEII